MKLRVNPKARDDIREIKRYIKYTLQNPIAATNTGQQITAAYKRLPDAPLSGHPLFTLDGTVTDYRFLVSGNYMIFYKIEAPFVSVYRVIYGGRDYFSILHVANNGL
jgi:plasmid stabilization system protein ParE